MMVEGTYYICIGRKRGWAFSLGTPKLTIKKPSIPKGHIAIKLKLAIPAALFDEFIPTGTITLPEDASIGRPAVEVIVPEGVHVTPDVKLALVPWVEEEDEGP
jgi:hypothetical protein